MSRLKNTLERKGLTRIAEEKLYEFEYDDELYKLTNDELYHDFLLTFDYDTAYVNDQYIQIIFPNGNELKIKLINQYFY